MNRSDPKQSVRELLEEAHPALIGLSHWIHANPEVGFEEHHASDWVNEWLQTAGFQVERGVADMPTALVGRFGPGPLHVAICVEYDALPEVGHACGHNIIAAAGVGAGLALASVAGDLGLRVSVLGTPAEESGGGKLGFIQAGYFNDVHAAVMVHPWPSDAVIPAVIAVTHLDVTYRGHEAHAAGFPHLGRNAADAMVVAQVAIGLLRQQLLPSDRVHGIVVKGGDAPNIIPALTTARYMVRAQDSTRLEELTDQVRRCFEAGAVATGTQAEIVEGTRYANMVHDADLAALYRHNASLLGRVFDDTPTAPFSTDMGDVSHVVPSIHPMIGIDTNGAVNHQREFADACASPSADQAILDGALGLAWTVIDAAQDQVIRARLLGDAVLREAVAIVEEVKSLDAHADLLDELAGSVAASDPLLAEQIGAAADALEERADELAEIADSRFEEAQELTDEALLDEVANELGSDLEDLAGALGPSGDVTAPGIAIEALLVADADAEGAPESAGPDDRGSWEASPAAAVPEDAVVDATTADVLDDIWGADEPDVAAGDARGTPVAESGSEPVMATEPEPEIAVVPGPEPEAIGGPEDAETDGLASGGSWQEPVAEAAAPSFERAPSEGSSPTVAAALDSAHAAWERDFLVVVRHAAWEEQYSHALASTSPPTAPVSEPAAEAAEAVAEAAPEAMTAEAAWEQPAEAAAEAAAEAPWEQPAEAMTAEAAPEAMTAEAAAEAPWGSTSDAAPEATADDAGTPEVPEAVAGVTFEPPVATDDIWYSGAPDEDLPVAELVPEQPVAVTSGAERTQEFVWIPADEDR